jgi:hypothetical protein
VSVNIQSGQQERSVPGARHADTDSTNGRRKQRNVAAGGILAAQIIDQPPSLSEWKAMDPSSKIGKARGGGRGIDGKAADSISDSKDPAWPGPVKAHQITLSAA